MTPAVVVIAYNRPEALLRLLSSVDAAIYPDGAQVPLIISIDRGESGVHPVVAQVAATFEWAHGAKQVIERPNRLGLVEHFRACGRLSRHYGDVILLEDDLLAGPAYYEFASRVCERYRSDARIAGACLYGLWFNGFSHDPFMPIEDGNDVFFLKLPYTQGLVFTAEQWQRFEAFKPDRKSLRHPDLHPAFRRFERDEWFPALAAYLAATNRYFCFPRVSLVTGWGDAGAHFESQTDWLQTPVQLRPRAYALPAFDEAQAVYDSFYELLPSRFRSLGADLSASNFDVDLNATRSRASLHTNHVLTTRPVRTAIASFGLRLYPPELNVAWDVEGDAISFSHKDDVHWDRLASLEARRRLDAYYNQHHRPSRKRSLLYGLAGALEKLRSSRGPDQPRK